MNLFQWCIAIQCVCVLVMLALIGEVSTRDWRRGGAAAEARGA